VAIIAEELQILDARVKQLKLDYEQYFLGSRPREPQQLRAEVQKLIVQYSSTPIQNTALRFRFNSIHSRFQSFKRQWDSTLRQIENGTYRRHLFKADMRERARVASAEGGPGAASARGGQGAAAGQGPEGLFESYREAARTCGQDVSGLTPDKLERVISRQREAVKQKLGCDEVDFRVVVQEGRVKLKASARR
jgi:hypothetical protein